MSKITLDRILAAGEAEVVAEAGQFVALGLDGLWVRNVMAKHKPAADTTSCSGLGYFAKLLLYPFTRVQVFCFIVFFFPSS